MARYRTSRSLLPAVALIVFALGVISGTPVGASDDAAVPIFLDATDSSGLDFVHFNGMSGRLYYVEVVGAGGALFDYDNDGDLDLYLVQGHLLGGDVDPDQALIPWRGEVPPRDRLFRNDLEVSADGGRTVRFVDVTEESGIRALGYGMGASAGDIDNDGWTDLYVLAFGRNQLWRNRGDGTFEEVAASRGVDDERWSVSASFSDFDADGWLDLFVVNYLDYSLIAHKTCLTERGEPDYCLPQAYRPVADRLYRNRGDGTFEDVSVAAGVAAASGNGLGVVAADLNGDRRLDFYVANDLMPNHLWLNRGDGTFVEDGLFAGAALNADGKAEASMGIAIGDPDGDRDFDLLVTHFRRESNTFWRNDDEHWSDVTDELGLGRPSFDRTSFGTGFLDFDNDGVLDLVVVNGAVTFRPGVDRSGQPFPLDEPNQLFRGTEGGGYQEVTGPAAEALARSEVSRGVLLGDVDNDGDTDVVVTNNSGPARLLLNQVGSERSWVGARLVTGQPEGADQSEQPRRDALGAVARLVMPAGSGSRRAHGDGGYASSSDPRVTFGLGDSGPTAVGVEVEWPDGTTERFEQLAVGRYHELRAGTGSRGGAVRKVP